MIALIPCFACIHWDQYRSCAAYPNGIPADIRLEGDSHDEVRGDEVGGITFTQNPAKADYYRSRQRMIDRRAKRWAE